MDRSNHWFKFYGSEYLSDPKIERLTPVERSCWITILCMASMGSDEGIIKFLTIESLLNRSGVYFDPYNPEDWEKALGVLKKFQDLDMIQCNEDGSIYIINWEKRQKSNLTNAERVARFRQKNKQNISNVTDVTHDVTQGVTNVTLDKIREDKIREDNIYINNNNNIYNNNREKEKNDASVVTQHTENKTKEFFNDKEKQDEFIEKIASNKNIDHATVKREVYKFVSYWTERNKSGKKQRWELEKTFEVPRRLETWFSNMNKFIQNRDNKPKGIRIL